MKDRPKDWFRIAFFVLSPVIGIIGTAAYAWKHGISWWQPLLFLVLYACVGISVTAGYHRLFAHRSYECHPLIQSFYLFFGAMALQNSILYWASDHRTHHRYVDHDWDPYNIQRGGWWAHILWIFYKNPPGGPSRTCPICRRTPGAAPESLFESHRHRRGPRAAHPDRRRVRRSSGGTPVGRVPARGRDSSHDVLRELDRPPVRVAPLHRGELGEGQPVGGPGDQRRGVPQLPSPVPRRLSATASAGTSGIPASGGFAGCSLWASRDGCVARPRS